MLFRSGIYMSDRFARALNLSDDEDDLLKGLSLSDRQGLLSEAGSIRTRGGAALDQFSDEVSATYFNDMKKLSDSSTMPANFVFIEHATPLKSLKFEKHPPSNSVRMGMCSLFADISGFTAYIDRAIATGTIAEAVANLHVIRREFVACLRDDFGGKKIRFIGDCLHGVTSKGEEDGGTAEEAVLTSGGLRSSFYVLQQELMGIDELGLAIGIEVGQTPISRIGLRGESSVRCSTSKATCTSEGLQSGSSGTETTVGEKMKSRMRVKVSNLVDRKSVV